MKVRIYIKMVKDILELIKKKKSKTVLFKRFKMGQFFA